jgi:thiol-disulfide isomerase/thioredoxin
MIMKNKLWIFSLLALVTVLTAASMLYPKLAERYPDGADGLALQSQIEKSGGAENQTAEKQSGDGTDTPVLSDNLTTDFTVYGREFTEVTLSEFFGKPIIVNFWASWCHSCTAELPAFNSVYEKYKDDVAFLMINLAEGETPSEVSSFISENGYTFPVYYDITGAAARAYGVYQIPETVFINADGSYYGGQLGALSETVLENYVNILLEK